MPKTYKLILHGGWLLSLLALVACRTVTEIKDSAPLAPPDVSQVPDAVPRLEPHSRYGNPESYVVFGKRYFVQASSADYQEQGIASWYGTKFHGQRTSSGEPYDMFAMTAAHKTLPIPTYARIKNLDNNRSVVVKINDRGPFHDERLVDLSYAAAHRLGILAAGTGRVQITALTPVEKQGSTPLLPPASSQATYLQAGAFREKAKADELASRMQRLNHLDVVIKPDAAKEIFKVQVGPLYEEQQIAALSAKIGSMTHSPPIRIVQ